jgi:lipopolysaccharide export system protein LptA
VSNDDVNTRTLIGNVRLQQKNVYVNCNTAIQYLNTNKFLLKGNVVITQETLVLRSQTVLYDGNSYLATSDDTVYITDRNNKLVGNRGTYSTDKMIANFYDEVTLEDDSIKVYANFITYNRQTTDSRAIGDVTVKSKNKNVFLQADTIDNFPNLNKTIAWSNSVLFQIDTVFQKKSNDVSTVDTDTVDVSANTSEFNLDTLSIKSDTMFAFRVPENEHYIFIGNVEFVRNELRAKSAQSIYTVADGQIILYDNVFSDSFNDLETVKSFDTIKNSNTVKKNFEQAIVWLDSTQLHSDSIVVILEENRLQNIHSFGNSIAISQRDTVNLARIDQLAGDEIILFIENDTLRKIESIGNAKSVFFSENNDEPDGVIEATAEKIVIEMEEGKAENIYLIKQIPGKYHPEPLVYGIEKKFYLPMFKKSDDIPIRPKIKNSKIFNQ